MEDKTISLTQYKLFLIGLKYCPFIIGIFSLIMVVLGCFGISFTLFPVLFNLSIFPTIIWILASIAFKCCIWHRLPLYYCWVNNVISWVDFKWTIPLNNLQMILVYLFITLMFILMGMYFKNKRNHERRTSKEVIT